jgi:large subunit ribosomal protein L6
MSRIGKLPVEIPSGVEVTLGKDAVTIKGPKGQLTTPVHPTITYEMEDGKVVLTRNNETHTARQQHGLRRTLLANCVEGVSKGFSKEMEIIGVGYRVQVQGQKVVLNLGFSHPVEFDLPKGIEAKAEGTKLTISGADKQLVGETCAKIRRYRPPEPYKGKGIKFVGEQIRRKAGKSGGK